jgi:hypothetical protein
VADVVNHSDHLLRLACNVLVQHGETAGRARGRADPARGPRCQIARARWAPPARPRGAADEAPRHTRGRSAARCGQALRFALPRTAIIHHCANEVTEPGPRGAKRQAILVGMGVHPGFADLMVLCDGRVCSSS